MSKFKELLVAIKPVEDTLLLDFIEEDVVRSYFEYFRAYHTFDEHILPGLHLLNTIKGICKNCNLVELAWWYHDIIYIPGSSHSEVISADKAFFDCIQLGYGQKIATTVRNLVMATQHSKAEAWNTQDEKVIHDLDLVTLGGEPEAYDKYTKKIREEYSFVNDKDFAQGRLQILEKFVSSELYLTKYFQDNYEKKALDNLRREIDTLKIIFSCSGVINEQ